MTITTNENPENQKQDPGSSQETAPELTPEEQEIVSLVERMKGRKLTQQEINFGLYQARVIGDL
jgi:hypothetical protein